MTNIRDAVEEICAGALSRGAREDRVSERLWLQTAAEAGCIGLRGLPGGVRHQVTFPGSYWVDSSCHELAQIHKGARVKGWGVVFVTGPPGPRKKRAPTPIPCSAPLNGPGRGVIF